MIRHVVMFSVRRPEDAEAVHDGLCLLKANPHALTLEVGRNLATDPIPGAQVDFVVYGEFADESALQAFKTHPTYAASIAAVRPLRDLRVSADFLSSH
ncbi:MAG: stress responsive protein [Rhodobacterales bacterium]|nr:MAG: stress responsive protein [Rhodobacterales bacterium]